MKFKGKSETPVQSTIMYQSNLGKYFVKIRLLSVKGHGEIQFDHQHSTVST